MTHTIHVGQKMTLRKLRRSRQISSKGCSLNKNLLIKAAMIKIRGDTMFPCSQGGHAALTFTLHHLEEMGHMIRKVLVGCYFYTPASLCVCLAISSFLFLKMREVSGNKFIYILAEKHSVHFKILKRLRGFYLQSHHETLETGAKQVELHGVKQYESKTSFW